MKPCFGSPSRDLLDPGRFGNEPVYCEAPHAPDDIICPGSDDEAYDSPADRRVRYEIQARRFLDGKPVFLLSASLRGPFDRSSGWVNPWRSKSASRAKAARRKERSRAVKCTAERYESSRGQPPATRHSHAPETKDPPPQDNYAPHRYMEDESFSRVWSWRETVLAQDSVPIDPGPHPSHTEPSSADSRRATQHTRRRRSGLTVDSLRDVLGSSVPFTPSAADSASKQETTSGSWEPPRGHVTSSLLAKAVGSSQAASSQNRHKASASPALPEAGHQDLLRLSPHAVRIYERHVVAEEAHKSPSWQPPDQEEANDGVSPAREKIAGNGFGRRHRLDARIGTPSAPTTQASPETDGSFRYRPKDITGKRRPLPRSKLAGSPSPASDTAARSSVGSRANPDALPKDRLVVGESSAPESAARAATQQSPDVPAEAEGQDGAEGAQQVECPRSIKEPDAGPNDQDLGEDDETAETASQIDGPTLVPSGSPSDSEQPSMPSFGHFSVEKHSQDVISDGLVGLPRRLLWPKSTRSTSRDPFSLPDLESSHVPKSSQRREPPPLRRSVSLEDGHAQACMQTTPAAAGEMAERDAEPATGRPEESGASNNSANETAQETELQLATAWVDSRPETAGSYKRLAPPHDAPEAQSPLVKDEAALESVDHPTPPLPLVAQTPKAAAIAPSLPRVTQSPWVEESVALLRRASGLVDHCKGPESAIAGRAVVQSAWQSPWTRGDSQIAAPEVRLFNPLSSPANSNVLTADDPVATQSQVPRGEDTDMRGSQLYGPPHPSTPETKRSGLPTPDFTFSVKSFREFMTPSPQPASKRPRIPGVTAGDDGLPSTQALVDAAVSNPWAEPPSSKAKKRKQRQPQEQPPPPKKKRVSWAPLPDDQGSCSTGSSSGALSSPPNSDIELPTTAKTAAAITATPGRDKETAPARRARGVSPPPPSVPDMSKLPATNEKFARHFAAVANRRGHRLSRNSGQQPGLMSATPAPAGGKKAAAAALGLGLWRSVPSPQQGGGSPALEAMAEAFIRADRGGAGEAGGDGLGPPSPVRMSGRDGCGVVAGDHLLVNGLEAGEGDTETGVEVKAGMDIVDREEEQEDGEEEGDEQEEERREEGDVQVDDVSAVLQNLDDFLQSWDLDAELAQRRAENRRQGVAGADGGFDPGPAGLMDVGVWD